jgi:hypothetical protein
VSAVDPQVDIIPVSFPAENQQNREGGGEGRNLRRDLAVSMSDPTPLSSIASKGSAGSEGRGQGGGTCFHDPDVAIGVHQVIGIHSVEEG